jgi:hypothetical protein
MWFLWFVSGTQEGNGARAEGGRPQKTMVCPTKDVLSRVAAHPITLLAEILPHN